MTELNKTVLLHLECPVCFEYMVDTIFNCINGHSICNTCQKVIKKCPICFALISKGRNYALEGVAKELDYPCAHNIKGCPVYCKLKEMGEHAAICSFRIYTCLVQYGDEELCGWTGLKCDLAQHVQVDHFECDFTDFWVDMDANIVQLIQAEGELFYIYRYCVENRSKLIFAMVHIGSSIVSASFCYKICIHNDKYGESFRGITSLELCANDLTSIEDIISSGRCVLFNMESLNTFKDHEMKVCFKIRIKKLPTAISR